RSNRTDTAAVHATLAICTGRIAAETVVGATTAAAIGLNSLTARARVIVITRGSSCRRALRAEPTREDPVVRLGSTCTHTTGKRPVAAVEADAATAGRISLLAGHCHRREVRILHHLASGVDVDHADIEVTADAALRDEVVEEGEAVDARVPV